MSRKRKRSRHFRVTQAVYNKIVRIGLFPSREELLDSLESDDSQAFSYEDMRRAWRSLLSQRVEVFLTSKTDGVRNFIPIEINGVTRHVPHGKATLAQLENFHRIERRNLDAVERGYRRSDIELEVLRHESEFRAGLTAGAVQELVEQAIYWLPTTT